MNYKCSACHDEHYICDMCGLRSALCTCTTPQLVRCDSCFDDVSMRDEFEDEEDETSFVEMTTDDEDDAYDDYESDSTDLDEIPEENEEEEEQNKCSNCFLPYSRCTCDH